MRWSFLIVATVVIFAGCANESPPPPVPMAAAPAPTPQAENAHEDWNIFPDPTTGTVEFYHQGQYVGGVTGDEPAEQDPPIPHKTEK